MTIYYDEARQDLYDELKKLDKVARGIGKTLKTVAKFFLILFLYLSLNAIVAILTNQTRSISPSIFNLVQESLRTFVQQNLPVLLACENTVEIYEISCTVSFVSVCGLLLTALVAAMQCVACNSEARNGCACRNQTYAQSEVSSVVTVSYKQHVSFLS